jgi:hypothetical protein
MRPLLVAMLAVALASDASASRSLVFTLETKQGPTVAHPHPPPGGVGDAYDSSLTLANAAVPQLGRPAHASVGMMRFTYTIRRQCTSFSPSCRATADFTTVTTLPGGTVTAAGSSISIANPEIVIPVTGGTGRYRRAHGTVSISPTSEKISTYRLRLP